MDHTESQLSHKALTNSENKNISSNEDGNMFSLPEKNELEIDLARPHEMAEYFELYTKNDAGKNFQASLRSVYGESVQGTLQSTENKYNFSNRNTSTESTASVSAHDSRFLSLQQESLHDIWSSSSLPFDPSSVSGDKDEEIGNYLRGSRISSPECDARKFPIVESNIGDYDETSAPILQQQNDVLNSISSTNTLDEALSTVIDVSYRDILDGSLPDSFEAIRKGIYLDHTNITCSLDISGLQRHEDVQGILQNVEKPQNEILRAAQASGGSECCNSGERVVSTKDTQAVSGFSSMKAEVRWQLDHGLFVCLICGKRSANKSQMVTHYRTHTGVKPFACNKCTKSFSQSNNLTRHLRTHTSPFACDQCGERYSNKRRLKMHYRIHTDENLYKCSICKIAFTNRSYQVSHYKNVHHINRKYIDWTLCGTNFKE